MNILNLSKVLAISALVLTSSAAFACEPSDRDATGACPAIGGGRGNNDGPRGYDVPGNREDQERRHYDEDRRREEERRNHDHGNGYYRPDPSPYDPPHNHGGNRPRPPHNNPPYYPPQPPPYYEPQPPPYYPPQPPPNYGEQVLQANIYETVYGRQQIDVDGLLSLYRYNGYRVVSVEVEAQSRGGYYNQTARLSLRVNGYEQSSAYMTNMSQRHYLSAGNRQIGWDLNDLTLVVDGDSVITRVLVRISR